MKIIPLIDIILILPNERGITIDSDLKRLQMKYCYGYPQLAYGSWAYGNTPLEARENYLKNGHKDWADFPEIIISLY